MNISNQTIFKTIEDLIDILKKILDSPEKVFEVNRAITMGGFKYLVDSLIEEKAEKMQKTQKVDISEVAEKSEKNELRTSGIIETSLVKTLISFSLKTPVSLIVSRDTSSFNLTIILIVHNCEYTSTSLTSSISSNLFLTFFVVSLLNLNSLRSLHLSPYLLPSPSKNIVLTTQNKKIIIIL